MDGGVREAGQGLGGGCKGFSSGGVGGRDTGVRDGAFRSVCRILSFLTRTKRRMKDALWGCGGVPTGAGLVDGGGRPRALIPGKGSGKGWLGRVGISSWWTGGQGGGARARGGCKGFGSGGVGGRDTGPRDGANFATCVVFLSFLMRTKRRKMAFFEGCPVGWGGYPPELAWWTGG